MGRGSMPVPSGEARGPAAGGSSPQPRREPLAQWKGFRLLSFQVAAIEALRQGHNVLLSAPTGAGKTLVAEYAVADAVARGKRCVYTAPIKALSNQKYRDFREDPSMDVGLMTGDVTLSPRAQVLIMTTEILRNAILEKPGGLADVETVIFDEIHFLDDPERGSVWEESLIFAPPGVRFLSLSATIANLDQLGAWMREIRPHELSIIRSERRPVPLTHRLYHAEHGLFALERLDWVRRRAAPRRRRREDRHRPRSERGGQRRLLDLLQEDGLLPALVFSFSRRDCEGLALANERRSLLDRAEAERMDALQRRLVEQFQLDPGELDGEVFRLGRRGVGYHHAGLLPIHKEVVERMFTSGLIKLLFTTETFALGINMPARTVVFASLRKFDGVAFDYMRTRDYMQMAGRAGRQGIDERGHVVSYLDQRDLEEAPLRRMIEGRPEPVQSRFRLTYATILHLMEHLGRERLHEAWQKSFLEFQQRAKSKKAREHHARAERARVEAQIALLSELRYLDASERLTPRGRMARLLYGFELQITEMLFRGVLEELPPRALATVFVGLVHEGRRRTPTYVSSRLFGAARRRVDALLVELAGRERAHGLPGALKAADWSLTPAVAAWCDGRGFDEVEELVEETAGDVCRTFRMALQLIRHVRRSLDPRDLLAERLAEVVEMVNRDEVDARRQLELG